MLGIRLDRNSPQSLALQLTSALRAAVRTGSLLPGDRLPPTRKLAEELEVSRNIVIVAYEQLVSEGYFESRVGRGTAVASGLTGETERTVSTKDTRRVRRAAPGVPRLPKIRFGLIPGVPDLRKLPTRRWLECLADAHRHASADKWDYADHRGEAELREELAAYLFLDSGRDRRG